MLVVAISMTQNMDAAFERRFLYKIEFQKPTVAIRESIWKEMIPEISDSESRLLAEQFNFSGGQIENIARKCTVDFVLSGNTITIDRLLMYCRDEALQKQASNPIGFYAD